MILFPTLTSPEQVAEYVQDTYRWSLRESSALHPNPLPEDYHSLCSSFDLGVVTQYAYDSNIPEMVQVIFYVMILDDTAELGLSCRIDMNCIMEDEWRRPSLPLASGLLTSCWPKGLPKVIFAPPQVLKGRGPRWTVDQLFLRWDAASSSSRGAPSTPGRSVLKKKGSTLIESALDIVADRLVFPRAPSPSDPQDGLNTHFPNPKVTHALKRTALEKKHLLHAGYSFVIPEADTTANELPQKCVVIYRLAFNYDIRFPLHPYNFLFVHRDSGWGDLPGWNEGKPIKNPFGEPFDEERRTARYFLYYIRPDDCPKPIPKFIVEVIESVQGPEKRKEQVRAKLTPFESGDATSEQIVAKAECCREEERARIVNVAAKKAIPLVSWGKKPAISLPPAGRHKRSRIEDHQDDIDAPTLTSIEGKEVRGSGGQRVVFFDPFCRSVGRWLGPGSPGSP
ncbi:hypothetical protein Cgig2_015859 [Carnegiea gigantea]|uniref:Uncharacterized protein n=1 Tax=Carnegiea gigantea TaxID=171969 RepID=A0A9Q1JHC1_9CARY|nr:hypothetical protein Cgig2_015859 [Carnegiea gigantea]